MTKLQTIAVAVANTHRLIRQEHRRHDESIKALQADLVEIRSRCIHQVIVTQMDPFSGACAVECQVCGHVAYE